MDKLDILSAGSLPEAQLRRLDQDVFHQSTKLDVEELHALSMYFGSLENIQERCGDRAVVVNGGILGVCQPPIEQRRCYLRYVFASHGKSMYPSRRTTACWKSCRRQIVIVDLDADKV